MKKVLIILLMIFFINLSTAMDISSLQGSYNKKLLAHFSNSPSVLDIANNSQFFIDNYLTLPDDIIIYLKNNSGITQIFSKVLSTKKKTEYGYTEKPNQFFFYLKSMGLADKKKRVKPVISNISPTEMAITFGKKRQEGHVSCDLYLDSKFKRLEWWTIKKDNEKWLKMVLHKD